MIKTGERFALQLCPEYQQTGAAVCRQPKGAKGFGLGNRREWEAYIGEIYTH